MTRDDAKPDAREARGRFRLGRNKRMKESRFELNPIRLAAALSVLAVALCLAGPRQVYACQEFRVEQESDPNRLLRRDIARLHREALEHYTAERYSEALQTYAQILENNELDIIALYNSACVQAKLGNPSKAAKLLVNAVSAGFIDFERMKNDPDLATVREEPEYVAIVEVQEEVQKAAADRLESYARRLLPADAIIERNDTLRLIYAAALDRETFDVMKERIEEQLTWQAEALFDGPPNSYVLLLIPTPELADRMIGTDRVSGFYDHDMKRLVTRDLGPSLQHELTHALHHAQMDRLGQRHPMWIQEGLASIFESYRVDPESRKITVLSNTRINIAINLREINGFTKWSKFFELGDRRFVRSRPRARYAEARAILQYLGEHDQLVDWYRTYISEFDLESTGSLAIRLTRTGELDDIEDDFREWLASKPKMPEGVPEDHPAIGLWVADQGANDGVEIVGIHPGGSARRAPVSPREVIVAINGQPIFSAEELVRVVLEHSTGDEVTLRLRRGTRYHEVTIKLRPVQQPKEYEIYQAPGALV